MRHTIHCLPTRLEAKLGRIGMGRPGPDPDIPEGTDLKSVVERFAREEIHVVAYD
jgi:hypothetical protein